MARPRNSFADEVEGNGSDRAPHVLAGSFECFGEIVKHRFIGRV
ncbi:hypothetical protein X729_18320 [Mesorhizobium sp. L103C131B0]|nr:hypothetical protein X729_18320 [Mesorhizobium sp. L103C131B0]